MKLTENCYTKVIETIKNADKVIVGFGAEWQSFETALLARKEHQWKAVQEILAKQETSKQERIAKGYQMIRKLVEKKDYFLITTNTDAFVYKQGFDEKRIVAPCGDIRRLQCEEKEHGVWSPNSEEDIFCPVCKKEGVLNIFQNKPYVESGYLEQWKQYQQWLQKAMNQKIAIIELGEGFQTPTVMRWPFEKLAFYQEKATLFCAHENFFMLPEEISERAYSIEEHSVTFVLKLEKIESEEKIL